MTTTTTKYMFRFRWFQVWSPPPPPPPNTNNLIISKLIPSSDLSHNNYVVSGSISILIMEAVT